LKECEGKNYIFRGKTERYSDEDGKGINSSLYRWAEKEQVVFHQNFNPFDIEKEIVEKAKNISQTTPAT